MGRHNFSSKQLNYWLIKKKYWLLVIKYLVIIIDTLVVFTVHILDPYNSKKKIVRCIIVMNDHLNAVEFVTIYNININKQVYKCKGKYLKILMT